MTKWCQYGLRQIKRQRLRDVWLRPHTSHSKLQRGLHRYRHIKSTAALQRQSNPGLLDPYVPSFSTCVSVQARPLLGGRASKGGFLSQIFLTVDSQQSLVPAVTDTNEN